MQALDYCEERLGRGTSRATSLMFVPGRLRAPLVAWHALARELADIAVTCHEPELARTKFGWWRAEIDATFHGHPSHPVTRALLPFLAAARLPEERVQALVSAFAAEIAPVRFAGYLELRSHALRTAGEVEALAASLIGATPAVAALAAGLGEAHALCDWLAATGQELRRDRLYLPGEDLARFGLSEAELFEGRDTPATRALLAFQAKRLGRLIDDSLAALPNQPEPGLLPGRILLALDRALLTELLAADWGVLGQRIALTPLRRLWIAWRTRRRARRSNRTPRLG
jgi:15-cis-phytoene synthase